MTTVNLQQQQQQKQQMQPPPPPPPQQMGPPPPYPGLPQYGYPAGAPPPPPPAAYSQPQQQQQSTVIINQPRAGVNAMSYGRDPIRQVCPYCSKDITTSTSKKCGGGLWIVIGIICFIGLWLPCLWLGCCLIPLCIPSMYDVEHTCPNCQRVLGKRGAMGGL